MSRSGLRPLPALTAVCLLALMALPPGADGRAGPATVVASDDSAVARDGGPARFPDTTATAVTEPATEDSAADADVAARLESVVLTEAAVEVLTAALAETGGVASGELLARVSRRADSPEVLVRAGLLARLDALVAQARQRPPPWPLAASPAVSATRARQLFEALATWGRHALVDSADYALDVALERSATTARISVHDARDLLAACLEGQGRPPSRGLPARPGLLITGASDYQVDSTRFAGLLRSEEDILRQTRFRNIHVPIVTALTPLLSAAPEVRWAVDQPSVNLRPDGVVRVEITDFYSRRRFRGPRAPMLRARVHVTLEAAGRPLYGDEFDVVYDFALETDAEVRGQRRLDGFVDLVAHSVRDAVVADLRRRLED